MIRIGIINETSEAEKRVAITPDNLKKFLAHDAKVVVESNAGAAAGFSNSDYEKAGASIGDPYAADLVLCVQRPPAQKINKNTLVVGQLQPHLKDQYFDELSNKEVCALSLELLPRTSRAQSMDVLSSQANIAGYRAAIEAALHYQRFLSMMMTSAGMAKPAKFLVLGVGVAGLQAIATAKRLGASVEAFDVRPETKEQVLSLGAKFVDLQLEESGVGEGGYAKALSEDALKKQQAALAKKISQMDIVLTTANVPGKKSPTLVTEDAVKQMRRGSVIIDMAAANGGNCPLTVANKVVEVGGVILVGHTNYPSMVASDASFFYGNNLYHFLNAALVSDANRWQPKLNLNDDLVRPCMVTQDRKVNTL